MCGLSWRIHFYSCFLCKINVWPLLVYKFLVLLFVWDSVVNLMHTRFTWRKRSCLQTVVNLIYNYTLPQKKGTEGGGGKGFRNPSSGPALSVKTEQRPMLLYIVFLLRTVKDPSWSSANATSQNFFSRSNVCELHNWLTLFIHNQPTLSILNTDTLILPTQLIWCLKPVVSESLISLR